MNAQKSVPNATPAAATARKTWVRRTPVEIVLTEIGRQEEAVIRLREELAREERELSKLQQAKRVLEST
jgi:hypothetical protein